MGILNLLVEYGANIDAVNSHGRDKLLLAALYGPLGMVRMLVDGLWGYATYPDDYEQLLRSITCACTAWMYTAEIPSGDLACFRVAWTGVVLFLKSLQTRDVLRSNPGSRQRARPTHTPTRSLKQ